MVHTLADDFAAEIAALCSTQVSDRQWEQFLDAHVPRTDRTGARLTGRALTLTDSKRQSLQHLYRTDPRVAPWAGTAHGVLQAVNTYHHHESLIRGDRQERNNLRTVTGEISRLDHDTWQTLQQILRTPTAAPAAST